MVGLEFNSGSLAPVCSEIPVWVALKLFPQFLGQELGGAARTQQGALLPGILNATGARAVLSGPV